MLARRRGLNVPLLSCLFHIKAGPHLTSTDKPTKQKHHVRTPTLNKEEEADDAHDGDDDAGDDEGQPPVRRHVVRGDQRTQDVPDRSVRVPQPHDQTSSD